MSDTQNEPLPGEKAIKVKKAGPILLGADRYDIFEKGQKAIREFVEELFRFLIDFPGMMYLVFILTIIVAGENRDKELMLEELAVLMNTSQYTVEIQHRWVIKHLGEEYKHLPYPVVFEPESTRLSKGKLKVYWNDKADIPDSEDPGDKKKARTSYVASEAMIKELTAAYSAVSRSWHRLLCDILMRAFGKSGKCHELFKNVYKDKPYQMISALLEYSILGTTLEVIEDAASADI